VEPPGWPVVGEQANRLKTDGKETDGHQPYRDEANGYEPDGDGRHGHGAHFYHKPHPSKHRQIVLQRGYQLKILHFAQNDRPEVRGARRAQGSSPGLINAGRVLGEVIAAEGVGAGAAATAYLAELATAASPLQLAGVSQIPEQG